MTKLEQNRVYAKHLGWEPRDFGAVVNDFTPGLVASIQSVQEILKVAVDGVAGPQTYQALLAARQQEMLSRYPTTGDKSIWLAEAGLVALYELKIAWMRDGGIIDLPSPASGAYQRCQRFIDQIIRTPIGIGWSWEDPYEANTSGQGNFEWCGAAAAFAYRKANLKLTIAKDFFPSTYRLDRYARYKQPLEHTPNPKPATGPYRIIIDLDERSTPATLAQTGFVPRAGDIMTVGPAKSAYGKHITLVERYDETTGMFTTVEGNGTGLGPDGARRHGVIRAQRPLGLRPGMMPTTYHARRLIRVAPSDLI